MKTLHKGLGLLLLFALLSCSSNKFVMPMAPADPNTSRAGEVVWVDLITNEAGKSQQFMSDLLGWKYEKKGNYALAKVGSKPVAGILEDKEILEGSYGAYWVLSASVKDLDQAATSVTANGGKVLSDSEHIEGRGKTALIQGPEGAILSLMQPDAGDPRASKAQNGEWLWAELWTDQVNASVDFYTKVLACTADNSKQGDGSSYVILQGAKYQFAGITELPVKDEESIWLPVLKVGDTKAVAAKAKDLGGAVLIEPLQLEEDWVALIATPFGAPFLIQD